MPLDNDLVETLPSGYKINGVAHYCQNTKPTGSGIVAGDRWYKPVDGSQWYWNGIYWLSNDVFSMKSDYQQETVSASKSLSGGTLQGRPLSVGRSGVYYVSASVSFYPYSATTASNYWGFGFNVLYTDGTVETLVYISGANKAGSTWSQLEGVINSPKNSGNKTILLAYCDCSPNGSPSQFLFMTSLEFRYLHS